MVYSSSVETMKKKAENIAQEIQKKSTRVKNIVSERENIKKQIAQIEKEIKEIEKERQKILNEIRTVSRTLEYGQQNLSISQNELERKQMQYKAKVIAWNRYNRSLEGEKEVVAKRNFMNLLYGEQERIEYIKEVHEDIKSVKSDTEKEKQTLSNLQAKLRNSLKEIDKKRVEQKKLALKLQSEQISHEKVIARLKQEKVRIEKEVARIIAARTKVTKNVKMETAVKGVGKLQRPVSGNLVVRYGQMKEQQVKSNGIEILARMGAPIKAAANGKVIYADNFQGLGKVIMIDYGYNLIGVYGNLISTNVKLNQSVTKGSDVGILGLTSDGKPHFYYELRFNLKPIDPVKMF